ncbi:MAG: hypothetical protein KIT10_06290 [Flavobacteriales bacterium]|nr:hypothetical protein [Flavobacteriales bacterium]
MFRVALPPILALLSIGLSAQPMGLAGGALIVGEDTRVTLDGPITWSIGTGAQLINDGLIDLGLQATLAEAEGSPITGLGMERAERVFSTPFPFTDPGGLGLTMACLQAVGPLVLYRGHQPIVVDDENESIARWYSIDAAPQTGAFLDLYLNYDPSELNGLDPSTLMLHGSIGTDGPWSQLGGGPVAQPNTVAAWYYSPWDIVTAFHFDLVTITPDGPEQAGPRIWPTLADDHVNVEFSGEEIRGLDVLDAAGRIVADRPALSPGATRMVLPVAHLTPGAYTLRINGRHTARFVKR